MKSGELRKIILELKNKQKFRFARSLKEYYKEEYEFLKEYTSFLSEKCTVGQRIYCFLNNIKSDPLCPTCLRKLNYRGCGLGYYKFCSTSCGKKNKDVEQQRKNTCFKKYGYYHNLAKNSPMRDKMIDNLKKKYGVENVSQIESVKDKKRKTYQKNHKEPHPLWGNTWYDVKIDNKEFRVQGYERYAIYDIINEYGIDDVLISYKDIKNNIGEIKYVMNSKEYRYYPDFYIISKNMIVEVKSIFTLQNNFDVLILKMSKCIDMGMNVKILVYNNKGKCINEVNDTKKLLKRVYVSCKK